MEKDSRLEHRAGEREPEKFPLATVWRTVLEGTAYGVGLGKGAIGVVWARRDAVWTQELVVEKQV